MYPAVCAQRFMVLTATAALVAGCAHGPRPRPPVADLASAHALVTQAEQSGAQVYDSSDLVAAQQELQQADNAANVRPVAAARLAQEASVDAQLAIARTHAAQEQNTLHQVNESLAVLRSAAGGNPVLPPPVVAPAPPPSPPVPATAGPQP